MKPLTCCPRSPDLDQLILPFLGDILPDPKNKPLVSALLKHLSEEEDKSSVSQVIGLLKGIDDKTMRLCYLKQLVKYNKQTSLTNDDIAAILSDSSLPEGKVYKLVLYYMLRMDKSALKEFVIKH